MFGKKKLIEGLKKRLSDTEAELKASKDLLQDSQDRLTDFQKQAYAKKTELATALESKESELKGLVENNKVLKAAADAAEKGKAEAASKLESAESALASVKKDLEAKESEIANLGDALKKKESEIASVKKDLEAKESEIANLGNALKLKESEISKTRDALKSFQDLAAEKDAKIVEAEKTLKSFQEMVKNNEVTSGGIAQGLANLNAATAGTEDKIAEAMKKFDDAMDAVDKAKTCNIAFVVDDNVISKAVMSSEADADKIPAIPAKEGFDAEWQYE